MTDITSPREIVCLPPPFPDDPYLSLFHRSLEPFGFPLCPDRRFDLGWLARNRGRVFAFHVHWLHLFYDRPGWRALPRFLWFCARMILLKVLGFRFFFTLHNLESHEHRHPILDRLATRLMIRLSDRVMVHGPTGAARVLALFPGARPGILPYFCSATDYPGEMTRETARARLGLAHDLRVFVHLGKIRPYKGLDLLVRAFRAVALPSERLILAGRPETPEIARELDQLAAGDPRVMTFLTFIPREEVQLYLRAADVAVYPYREILTAGSPGLALGFGLPVVASKRGSVEDLVPEAGRILFDPDRPGALEEALVSSRSIDAVQARAVNLERAAELTWEAIGARAAALYHGERPGHT